MNMLKDRLFINKSIAALARKQYDKVERSATSRLKEYPNNYGALYVLALAAYYEKNINLVHNYFLKLTRSYRVNRRIQKWFIRQVLSYPLYKENSNEIVRDRSRELIPLVKIKGIKIEILKHLCIALYRLNQAKEAFEVCMELRHFGFVDKHLAEIEQNLRKALHMDQLHDS